MWVLGPMGGDAWHPQPYRGQLIPLGIATPLGRVLFANAEVTACSDAELAFAEPIPLGDSADAVVEIETDLDLVADGASVTRNGSVLTIRAAAPITLRRP